MASESMTAEERVQSAIRLEKPDRVPIAPLLTQEPVACLAGLTPADVADDNEVALSAFLKVFDKFGGWDTVFGGTITSPERQALGTYPMKIRVPGKELPDDYRSQLVEEEILQLDDYDKIAEMGMEEFFNQDYLWRITDTKPDDIRLLREKATTGLSRHKEALVKLGVKPIAATGISHPFFRLCLMRSLVAFTQDLYYNPEPVERAIRRMTTDLIAKLIPIVKASGINRWLFTEERASCCYYPLPIFERFWWTYTKEIVDAFWSEGIVTVFHLDTCWEKNLPYFRKLPRGSAVLQLDSTTDIFQAKELLRGHLCLYGDIPASLFSIGSVEEIEDYCRKLIDEIGGDGGFILGTGCAVPGECKPENFRAMIDTGKNYEFSTR